MDERLRVETAISLMEASNKNEIDRLKVAYGNYNIAKKNCEPFLEDLKAGMASINQTYKEAGLDAPFVLSYEDLETDLKVKQANIKDLETKRDAARREYISIEEDIQKYPGLTYGEVKERQEEARKTWDEYNAKVDAAWIAFRKAEDEKKTIKKDEFNEKCNSYEYLKELVESKKDAISSTFVQDERTTNMIKVQLYSLGINLDSLKSKYGVLNDSVKIFEEISKKLGIDLIYDDNKSMVKENQVEAKTSEKTEEKVEEEQNLGRPEETEEPVVNNAPTESEEPTEGIDETGLTEEQKTEFAAKKKKADEKVPLGQRFKQTKERAARIAPFGKCSIGLGALTGVCCIGAGALSFALPVAAVTAGINVGAQALYDIILKNNGGRIPSMERSKHETRKKDQYTATWLCATAHKGAQEITNRWKLLKEKKLNSIPKEEPEKVETLDTTSQTDNLEASATPESLDVNDIFEQINDAYNESMGSR